MLILQHCSAGYRVNILIVITEKMLILFSVLDFSICFTFIFELLFYFCMFTLMKVDTRLL
jgi:hypothetical protein